MAQEHPQGGQQAAVKEMDAKAGMYQQMYERAKTQLRVVLSRRVDAFRRSVAGSQDTKRLVAHLQRRLLGEEEERDQEAAMHTARMRDLKKEIADLKVDRRMLQAKVEDMQGEVRRRGDLDAQMEVCVGEIVGRMRALEEENGKLKARGSGGVKRQRGGEEQRTR
eukprot:evm.model.scf_421.1 EVM.evm.TU.scf_421.1   scf_421:7799-9661(+)